MKSLLTVLILLFLACGVSAQQWNYYGAETVAGGWTPSMEIDAQGVPYVVYTDYDGVKVSKYNGTAWVAVGDPISVGSAGEPSIALDAQGTPYIAFAHSPGYKANVMKFNGTSWEYVGSAGFSPGSASYLNVEIAADGTTPYVCFRNNANSGKATVMKYNGTSWESVGSAAVTANAVAYPNIAFAPDGTLYMAYQEEFSNASVMKYSGGTWVTVGQSGFTLGSFIDIEVDAAGVLYTASMNDGNAGKGVVHKFNGTSWVTVGGTGLSSAMARRINIKIYDGTPYVAYQNQVLLENGSEMRMAVKKFDGTSWVTLGQSATTSYNIDYPSLAIDGDGIPYVAFNWYGESAVSVMKFSCSPSPPANATASSNLTVCPEAKATLTVTSSEGNTVRWYDQEVGGDVLGEGLGFITENLTQDKTYYADAVNSCGVSLRTAIHVRLRSKPQIYVQGKTTLCKGEATTLQASGGVSYQWENGPATADYHVTPQSTSIFVVIGTAENGCSATFPVTVTVNELPDIAIAGKLYLCPGDNTTLTATGANSYQWRNGPATAAYTFVPSATATYLVKGSDSNNCTNADSVTVTVTNVNVSILAEGHTLVAEASSATYQWINCDLNALVFGATKKTFTPEATGNYAVAISQGLCVATSSCQFMLISSTETTDAAGFDVYPNPSNGVLHVKSDRNGAVKVVDNSGRTIRILEIRNDTDGIEIDGLSDGFYHLFFTDAAGGVRHERLIVTKGR